jgi:ABC-type sugar transport system substrate-binding protein
MKHKWLLIATIVIMLASMLAACGGGQTAKTDCSKDPTPPPLAKKDKYKVGFSQVETNNPWRIAETESMKAEATKLGHELVYTDAGGSEAKQIADVESMIAQKVDLIFMAPRSEQALAEAVLKAKAACIPVILLDRDVDHSIAAPGTDFVTMIGSDFVEEGRRTAEWLANATNQTATIIELEGTVGSSPANDRKKGFDEEIAKYPNMKIVASQSGDFARDKGRQVAETLLQAHPDTTAIYAHNDEMAIGAIAALEAAGKVPGKDVIVVSIDGTKDATQAILDGTLGATCECSPKFGPKAFEVMAGYANGETYPAKIVNPDRFFDITNAAEYLPEAY